MAVFCFYFPCIKKVPLDKKPKGIVLGMLAHEIAHLAKGHNNIQLIIGGGNFIVTIFILLVKAFSVIVGVTSIIKAIRNRSWITAIAGVILAGIIWGWTKFCTLFLRWSMRENEFEADLYAVELGYVFEVFIISADEFLFKFKHM